MSLFCQLKHAVFALQGVHDDQNSANYRKLEHLISYVVQPYLSSSGLRAKPTKPVLQTTKSKSFEEPSSSSSHTGTPTIVEENVAMPVQRPRPVSVGSLELQSKYSADRLHEAALQTAHVRRFTYDDSITESSGSAVFNSGSSTVT